MVFERLTLSGFKSFPDTTHLDILPGLTGIVGPNGCGKSNLLDGLRFVLGSTSGRQLRGGSLDHLVFHGDGAGRRQPRNVAEVSLRIATPDGPGGVPTKDGRLDLVRRVERGQGTTWRADGRLVTGADARSFLRRVGSGAGSVAIVRQKSVDDLIDSKKGERRTLLEEAAGVGEAMVRRKQTVDRLEGALGNMAEADTALESAEARLRALRRQASSAEKAARLEASVARWDAIVRLAAEREAAEARDAAKDVATAAAEKDEAARAAHAKAERALEGAASGAARARDGRDAAHTASLLAEERRRTVASAHASAVRILTEATAELDRARTRMREVSGREAARAAEATEAERVAADTATAVERSATAAARASEDLERLRAEADVLSAEAVRLERELAEATGRAEAVRAARSRAEGILVTAGRSLEAAEREASLAEASAPPPGSAARAVARAKELDDRSERAAAAVAEAVAEEGRTTARRATAEAALTAARGKVEGLVARLEATSAVEGVGGDGVVPLDGRDATVAGALTVGRPTADGRWTEVDRDGVWPVGTVTLADLVEVVPPGMGTWMSSVAVSGGVTASDIPIGGTVVDDDGRAVRWDGFVSDGPGVAAARSVAAATERRRTENLLTEARVVEADLAEAVRTAARGADEARSSLEVGRTRAKDASEAARVASDEARDARRAEEEHERRSAAARDRVRVARERYEGVVADLRALGEVVEPPETMRTAADRARRRADAATAAAADAMRAASEVSGRYARLRSEADDARRRAERARATMADDARDMAVLRVTVPEAEGRVARARDAVPEDPEGATAVAAQARDSLATADRGMAKAEAALAVAKAEAARTAAVAAEARDAAVRAEVGLTTTEASWSDARIPDGERTSVAERAGDGWEGTTREEALAARDGDRRARDAMGAVNALAATQAEEEEGRVGALVVARNEVRSSVADLREALVTVEEECRERLHAAFLDLNARFSSGFVDMFGGGEGALRLAGSDDILECSIEVQVAPPGKKSCPLSLLSGGERSLAALVLILAAFTMTPAPVCVLDEVDAALSDVSRSMMCDAVRSMSDRTGVRFLVVTHHALSMSRMDRLVGVTMSEPGVSSVTTVDLVAALEASRDV